MLKYILAISLLFVIGGQAQPIYIKPKNKKETEETVTEEDDTPKIKWVDTNTQEFKDKLNKYIGERCV